MFSKTRFEMERRKKTCCRFQKCIEVIFWNLNVRGKSGFPGKADTKGLRLVNGFSQTILAETMIGNFPEEEDSDLGVSKPSVTPFKSFMGLMHDEIFNPIDHALYGMWSSPVVDKGEISADDDYTVVSAVDVPETKEEKIKRLEKEMSELQKELGTLKAV